MAIYANEMTKKKDPPGLSRPTAFFSPLFLFSFPFFFLPTFGFVIWTLQCGAQLVYHTWCSKERWFIRTTWKIVCDDRKPNRRQAIASDSNKWTMKVVFFIKRDSCPAISYILTKKANHSSSFSVRLHRNKWMNRRRNYLFDVITDCWMDALASCWREAPKRKHHLSAVARTRYYMSHYTTHNLPRTWLNKNVVEIKSPSLECFSFDWIHSTCH
jgi:hypothetical protein